ncbi:MAG: PASTA domain-containing protein [Deltaproteobacteria bacterium]|nr:PASTA domain-containing protein [Deltaproteobacteria bacterium]
MARRVPLAAVAVALALGGATAGFLLLARIFEKTPEVKVPALVGIGLSEALDHLGAARLDLEVRGFEYSDEIPENLVLRQRPEAGQVVKAKRSVRVVLSRGPERHQVPDVGGLSLDDARIQLEEAGFRAGIAARIHGAKEDEVVGQGVQPGAWLLKGRPVPLLVGAGKAPALVRMPALEGLTLDRALAEMESSSLRQGTVEPIRADESTKPGVVVRQSPASGYPVPRGAAVALAVASAPTEVRETPGGDAAAPEESPPSRPAATPSRVESHRGKAEGVERP